MTPPPRPTATPLPAALTGGLVRQLGPIWPWAAALAGGGLALDAGLRLSHLAPSSALGFATLLGGAWWVLRSSRPAAAAAFPADPPGWLERLQQLEAQFTALAADQPEAAGAASQRRQQLDAVRRQLQRSDLAVALVGRELPPPALQQPLAAALRSRFPLRLHWGHPLPGWQPERDWPRLFEGCELILYHLRWPLAAADLRWLEALPEGLPAMLLIQGAPAVDLAAVRRELAGLLAGAPPFPPLFWDGEPGSLTACLTPLAERLHRDGAALRQAGRLRALSALHGRWQGQLESLRRQAFQRLQQRTQWLVAAGVFASPVLSLDLLVLAVANGLMLREMARLWDCPWSGEQLQAAATELGRAALAFGVVDWSSQALAGLARWHGATWLVGGAVQALSAAYLTRVVGRAMADLLARSVGVSEPDLERIRREAPLVVAAAAEAEKLDWQAFLQQGRAWLASGATA